jgi:hypothetical protein
MAAPKSQLAVQLADARGKTVGRMNPDALIREAINKWGEGDLFYRGEVPGLAWKLNSESSDLNMCMFRQPGTDHYFALPENRSVLLNRLGINGDDNGGYTSHIKAVLIQALDEEGFEYLGSHKPQLKYASFGNVRVETKGFKIDRARLGKILKTDHYAGFKLDDARYKGAWCLVPLTNIVREEVPFTGLYVNV